jgi:hypothetical protein
MPLHIGASGAIERVDRPAELADRSPVDASEVWQGRPAPVAVPQSIAPIEAASAPARPVAPLAESEF